MPPLEAAHERAVAKSAFPGRLLPYKPDWSINRTVRHFIMKTILSACALLLLCVMSCVAKDPTNSVVGVWKVNWEKAPVIETIPERYKFRFKTLEDYRKYVTQRAMGLVLNIQANQTAVLRYGDGKSENYRWEIYQKAPKHDIWLQTNPHFLSSASIGHGFKVSGANTATLLFQLEWDEDAATRVQLVMERQQPDPTKPK